MLRIPLPELLSPACTMIPPPVTDVLSDLLVQVRHRRTGPISSVVNKPYRKKKRCSKVLQRFFITSKLFYSYTASRYAFAPTFINPDLISAGRSTL